MGAKIGTAPCEACRAKGGDQSGNNRVLYDNNTSFCFACGTWTGERSEGAEFPDAVPIEFRGWKKRGLTETTMRKFGVGLTESGEIAFPYYNSNNDRVAQKLRDQHKNFTVVGDIKPAVMFGQQLWPSHGRSVVITEGEIDAMSMSQVFDNKWPVVSVRNGAGGAATDVKRSIEWLESYDRVVFMFDQDEAGKRAAEECAPLLTPGKAFIARLPLKDANEMVMAGRSAELVRAFWDATQYKPEGVVRARSAWELMRERPVRGLSYPWAGLDNKLMGIRTRELVIWTGGPGGGKSALTKHVARHLMNAHTSTVGYLGLEEHVSKSMLDFISIAEERQLHLEEDLSDAQLRPMFEAAFRDDRLVLVNHVGGLDMEQLLPRLRHMVLGERCSQIILDHVSILLGDTASEGNERARLDEILTQLRMLAEQLNIGIHAICHLRKATAGQKDWSEGRKITLADLRGTGCLAQLASAVIGVERDTTSANDNVRCTSTIRILKNRFAGRTGVACYLRYDEETGAVRELDEDEVAALNGSPDQQPSAPPGASAAGDMVEFQKATEPPAAAPIVGDLTEAEREALSPTEESF